MITSVFERTYTLRVARCNRNYSLLAYNVFNETGHRSLIAISIYASYFDVILILSSNWERRVSYMRQGVFILSVAPSII